MPTLPISAVEPLTSGLYSVMLHPKMPVAAQRWLADHALAGIRFRAGTVIRRERLGGRPVAVITVGATLTDTAVLYLHGGGYVVGSSTSHAHLAADIAAATGATVYVLDYRRAPEHVCPAAVDDAVAAYRDLLDRGWSPRSVAIAGDSAGGGLSVATAQVLRDVDNVSPAALGLIAPWVDPSDDRGPQAHARDIVVNHPWSRACAAMYLGSGSVQMPGYAPGNDDLRLLPPTTIHVGRREALYAQDVTFAGKLRAAGVAVEFVEFERLWHVAHQQASMLAEARAAIEKLGRFLRTNLAAGDAGGQTVFQQFQA